jgi:FAD/FMN-containing dehydrogenase
MIGQFAAIVGDKNVLTEAGDRLPYAEGGRGLGPLPSLVVRPRGEKQMLAVVALARELGLQIILQGARTGLVEAGLAQADCPAIILSTERHNATIAIDADNRTAKVDAGVRLSSLNDAVASSGLYFPIDLGADPSIGGMIAANTGGARFLRYGDVRRNTVSIDCILPDVGQIVRLGKGLWKDNSALDLKQCIIGSSGALSIVTSATLALQPLPTSRSGAIIQLADASWLAAILRHMEGRFGSLLTAFEGMSANAVELALKHVPALRRPFSQMGLGSYYLLVELSGPDAISHELLDALLTEAVAEIFSRFPKFCLDAVVGHIDDFWAIRHAIPAALRASGTVVACDISMPRGSISEFRLQAEALARKNWPMLMLADFGHIGDGGLHFNFVWTDAERPMPAAMKYDVQAAIFEKCVTEFDGSFSAEHGIGPANIEFYRKFVPPDVRALSAAVQSAFASVPLGRVNFG